MDDVLLAVQIDEQGVGSVVPVSDVSSCPFPHARPTAGGGPFPVAGRHLQLSASLTPRVQEVAGLAAHGLTNEEIGAAIYISATTVKYHLNRITTKLGTRNRIEIAAWAWQHGLAAACSRHAAFTGAP